MKLSLFFRRISFTLVLSLLITSAWAAPDSILSEELATLYDQGVGLYRDGNFDKAAKAFKRVALEAPEAVEGHYYYAISMAQLGRFKEARAGYESVMRLSPESETAELAKQGLAYLPAPEKLDIPPQFQRPQFGPAPKASEVVQAGMTPSGVPQSAPAQPAMDPQAMQMMMLMGAMGGGGGKGGFNPMMIPMMQGMGQGQNGGDPENKIPPEVFSSMMMNQMLENFSPFSSDKDD